jgi:hypothetical protein
MLTALVLLLTSSNSFGSDTTVKLKEGGAVTAFSKEDGFKLSNLAAEKLGVKFTSLNSNGPWKVPKESLIRIKYSTGVYRKWDGWITMVLVTVLSEGEDHYLIKSIDLQNEDEIAISAVSYLRMTEADLNSDTVDACAH